MALTYYVNEFKNAREQSDATEMLFQIHLMLQQDPFDQQNIIRDCMRDIFIDFPDLQYTGTFPDLDLSTPESSEAALGRELHWVEERLCVAVLDRIREIAVSLERYGILKRIAYPISETPHTTRVPVTESYDHKEKPSDLREERSLPWKAIGIGAIAVVGLLIWRC